MSDNKKIPNVPNLRFPEFTGEWKERKLQDIATFFSGGTPNTTIKEYYYHGDIPFIRSGEINSITTELFISDEGLKKSSAKLVDRGALLIALYGATSGEIAISKIKGAINQAILCIETQQNKIFLRGIWLKHINNILRNYLQGGQGNLSADIIKKLKFHFTCINEQDKIAAFLSLLDQRIETQSQIIKELKSFKKILRNNLYQQIVSTGKSERIENLLHYEQPTNYIVTNTNYSNDNSLTPVLTANKAFVLGYIDEDFGMYNKGECVIFDDFTMDLKYVDFPFKVKSSAIKILTAKRGVNLRYISEYLSFLKLTPTDHKRHYISEIEPRYMPVPEIEVQNRIANTLFILDKKIDLEIDQYELLVKHKKYLMSQMFI